MLSQPIAFEATPIEVADYRSDDQLRKKTATLIGLCRENALYGELQLKRALCFCRGQAKRIPPKVRFSCGGLRKLIRPTRLHS